MVDQLLGLCEFPLRYPAVAGYRQLRKFPFLSYVIYFEADAAARAVEVVRIWDNRRNPAELGWPRPRP